MTKPPEIVLIIGALSDIGRAIAHEYASAGHPLILAARRAERLAADVADIGVRYSAAARAVECDVLDVDPAPWFDALGELPGVVVCVAGLLGDQARAERDPAESRTIIDTNFTGPALLFAEAASRMERRGAGVLVGVSSVAGERGRASNYVYGSAKAGFTAYLSGLRNRLAGKGIQVITIKPGFVDTRMTRGMKLPKPLTAAPAEVARAVVGAHRKGRDVVYVRPIWALIMLVIRCLPEAVFKKLSL